MEDDDNRLIATLFTVNYCHYCGIPLQLSRDTGLSKSCAYKEFRFPPPFAGKKKEKKTKKLPPIPENMLPRRHNSFEEVDLNEFVPLPSISPTIVTEKVKLH